MPLHLTIITGASRGLGLAIAQQCCAPNALLLCISRGSSHALNAHARQHETQLTQWPADLSEPAAVASRLQHWLAQRDPVKLASATLINNAGVIAALQPLRAADAAARAELSNALRVSLEAPLLLSAAFLAATASWHMVPRKVLNISSGLGRRAMASSSAYCAAKAGMDHFSRCMALEEAQTSHGAKICSLAPGIIDTDMQLQLRSADSHQFPDQPGFASLSAQGLLISAEGTAQSVLAYLARSDFGKQTVADVRDTDS
jgi:NAD(P)-dependent dehydrogenase (short-subunit alcohol dehydrogenase family)